MSWTLRPTVLRRKSDGTTWTAHHPGHPCFFGWWLVRIRPAWIGWWVDYSDVWSFTDKENEWHNIEIVKFRE